MTNVAMRRSTMKGMRRRFAAGAFFVAIGLAGSGAAVMALPVEPPLSNGNLQAQVEAMQAEALQQALAMNDVKSAELSALLKRYKVRQMMLEKRYRAAVVELDAVVNGASDLPLSRAVRQVEEAMDVLRKLTAEKWHAIKMQLTLKQQARYLIYQAALQRALKRKLVEGLANRPVPAAGD